MYNQNQIFVNVNSRINAAASLFGFYVLNHAMSNTDGLGTFPANPITGQESTGPPQRTYAIGLRSAAR